jgi:hypothetical protein
MCDQGARTDALVSGSSGVHKDDIYSVTSDKRQQASQALKTSWTGGMPKERMPARLDKYWVYKEGSQSRWGTTSSFVPPSFSAGAAASGVASQASDSRCASGRHTPE